MSKAQREKLPLAVDADRKIKALAALGEYFASDDAALTESILLAYAHNKWFTPENVCFALKAIAENYLDEKKLQEWFSKYQSELGKATAPRRIALIMAGNIPLAGFHDLLCALMTGNIAIIRQSSKDKYLLPQILERLCEIDSSFKDTFEFTEQLKNFDAVIATGSDNSSRYFEYYFGKHPHIIRKNRNSVAVLTGTESNEQLLKLGDDMFRYFGLGCRSVSKIFAPREYDFTQLLTALEPFDALMEHNGYKNNYDYNLAISALNKAPHLASSFLLMNENSALHSPIATVNFERYERMDDVLSSIDSCKNEIQCVVGDASVPGAVGFGQSQLPHLSDYADGVDTMKFLLKL